MGSVFSAIGRGIIAIIDAIASVLITIVSVIIDIIVSIFDLIVDIITCRCFSNRRRFGSNFGRRRLRRSYI